ncbi:MAG: integration host factor [Coriobacteriales bacterium]|nr:integration host factor [Coriobacteriales bacterium]
MALPKLTEADRKAALEKAMMVRQERAKIKAQLKSGELTMAQLMEKVGDEVVGKIKVKSLLESMPGIGKARAAKIMEDLNIAESRNIKGLGPKQLENLLKLFK